jgi:hypothetical protein
MPYNWFQLVFTVFVDFCHFCCEKLNFARFFLRFYIEWNSVFTFYGPETGAEKPFEKQLFSKLVLKSVFRL